jgi:hypothetical protein
MERQWSAAALANCSTSNRGGALVEKGRFNWFLRFDTGKSPFLLA